MKLVDKKEKETENEKINRKYMSVCRERKNIKVSSQNVYLS